MSTDALFQISSTLALLGWIVLLASPLLKRWAWIVSGAMIPLLLSIAYAALILVFWFDAEGGFDTLANVQRLFANPEAALAGWIHFLAFDLLIGTWVARTASREGVAFLFVVPCLFLTFMFGPAGYLAFSALRVAHGKGVTQ